MFSRIGTSDIATDPMPPNEATFTSSTSRSRWADAGRPRTRRVEPADQATLKRINPDWTSSAQPIEMRFNEMLEGTKAELSVKIFGDDYDVLEKLAAQIKPVLEGTPGAAEVEFETEGRTPQLQINVRREVLQRYGLQAAEVNKAVNAALAGEVVGAIVSGSKRNDIVVRMPEELRADDEAIKMLPVRVGATDRRSENWSVRTLKPSSRSTRRGLRGRR